jgi:uridylate kinase
MSVHSGSCQGRLIAALSVGRLYPYNHHEKTSACANTYKRILLLVRRGLDGSDDAFGINRATDVGWSRIAGSRAWALQSGCGHCGNIFRRLLAGSVSMDRATADYMSILATVMNALALGDTMNKARLIARVISAIGIERGRTM